MGGTGRSAGLRDLLDTAIRGKELASGFFGSLAQSVDDAYLRRCFRRLAQEEWDHRKILVKHRRELFGRPDALRAEVVREACLAFAGMAERPPIRGTDDLRLALRLAIRAEQEVHRFFTEASRNFDDRAVKVFLRILAEEGLAQVEHLREALSVIDSSGRRVERRATPRTLPSRAVAVGN